MEYSRVSELLRQRGAMLVAGKVQSMLPGYLFPLPVFLQNTRLLIRSQEQAVEILTLLRAALLERGVYALRPEVTAVDLPRNGRFRAWVDWVEMIGGTAVTHKSSAVYYFRQTGTQLQTEMVNYTELSMPDLNRQIANLALSA